MFATAFTRKSFPAHCQTGNALDPALHTPEAHRKRTRSLKPNQNQIYVLPKNQAILTQAARPNETYATEPGRNAPRWTQWARSGESAKVIEGEAEIVPSLPAPKPAS